MFWIEIYSRVAWSAKRIARRLVFELAARRLPLALRTPAGRRFAELGSLVEGCLLDRITRDPEVGRGIASQLLNVIYNCDRITYNEPGTADAYALLHFLDRYHRFQLIFDLLSRRKLMPLKHRVVDILDVGTGPGPSMFAASDFYSERFGYVDVSQAYQESRRPRFKIDYVERSTEFRDWLHYFTEYANSRAPTGRYWCVPYHHGTFSDFSAIEFDQRTASWDQDEDGDSVRTIYIRRNRFDLIVFSNFLTKRHQVMRFKKELRACARFLRRDGVLLVVGATDASRKYREVYDAISGIILERGYGSRKFTAWCKRVNLEPYVLSYRSDDPYGEPVKQHLRAVYSVLHEKYHEVVPEKAARILGASIAPGYNRTKAWQMLAFRKIVRTRPQVKRSAGGRQRSSPGRPVLPPGRNDWRH